VPLKELESESIAHLDVLGFRYDIPALMLSVLGRYESSNLRVIGTLKGVYPKKDNRWEYHMHRYGVRDQEVRAALDQKCRLPARRQVTGNRLTLLT